MGKSSTKKKSVGRPNADYQNQDNLNMLKERFRELYDDKSNNSYSFDEMEKKFGISHSTTNALYNGERININTDNLITISNIFNVSIDYLVGIHNRTSKDLDVQLMEEKLGLSEFAVKNLMCFSNNEYYEGILKFNKIIDSLLCSNKCNEILGRLEDYLEFIPNNDYDDINYDELEEIKLRRLINAITDYKNSLPDIVENYEHSLNYYSSRKKELIKLLDSKKYKVQFNDEITDKDRKLFNEYMSLRNKMYHSINSMEELEKRIESIKLITTKNVEKNRRKKGE